VQRPFAQDDLSQWGVLAVTAVGIAGLVAFARLAGPRWARWFGRGLSVFIVVLNVGMQVVAFRSDRAAWTLPLQLSDLAPYAAALGLWTLGWRAFSLTYYWGLVLSTQALLTPVFSGPPFPSAQFLAFFGIHTLVVWAAVYLAWGLGVRPSWRGYRFTVLLTAGWAAAMLVFNRRFGTDYGFLSAKPSTHSVLDLLGRWPWYLVPEFALVLAVWALITWPWVRRCAAPQESAGAAQR
jgi:hypothetical integral membrane protein (TIGR02206 family)